MVWVFFIVLLSYILPLELLVQGYVKCLGHD